MAVYSQLVGMKAAPIPSWVIKPCGAIVPARPLGIRHNCTIPDRERGGGGRGRKGGLREERGRRGRKG
jgi:hypothetical protein